MRIILSILLTALLSSAVFSQTDKLITLQQCIEGAINNHPLQQNENNLTQQLSAQHEILDKSKLPQISWNTQAKIQSESLGLEFDNPMIPSIEIPLYNFQTSLDLEYVIYDGGANKIQKRIQKANNQLAIEKNQNLIDNIKQDVIKEYLVILFLDEKERVLKNSLTLIEENLETLKEANQFGVINKSDIQQLEIRKLEILSQIESTNSDEITSMTILSDLTGLIIPPDMKLSLPKVDSLIISDEISQEKLKIYDLQSDMLESQKDRVKLKKRPKAFAFVTAGTGYPNPLNFFNDELSLFAVGGLGFKWQFLDWGAESKELQLIKLQQEQIQTEKSNSETILNRYNAKFKFGIQKYRMLIKNEETIISLKKELATIQQDRLQKGTIIPLEYIETLNDIIKSELKLNQYNLEIIKLKLEYQLLKGLI